MYLRLAVLSIICSLTIVPSLCAQTDFIFTKAFDKKLKKYGLQYIQPEDLWLHPVPHEDEYDSYDLVLYSEDQDLEVRYIFRDKNSTIALSAMPQFEFYRSILDFASNEDETNQIVIQDVPTETANEAYNADWCLIAEFTPKQSISLMPKGRILGIYKEQTGLIFCMVFYKNEVPEYFISPIKFSL